MCSMVGGTGVSFFLIAFTSFCIWGSGLLIEKYKDNPEKAKAISALNIVLNLLILWVLKYYDFFAREFAELFGLSSDGLLLNIILPVGISFYTFQALSYSIDVYRGKLEPTHDVVQFFAFVSFFPQLVAVLLNEPPIFCLSLKTPGPLIIMLPLMGCGKS